MVPLHHCISMMQSCTYLLKDLASDFLREQLVQSLRTVVITAELIKHTHDKTMGQA